MFRNRTFRFSIEISFVAVAAAVICFGLSYWQYERYLDKEAYQDQLAAQEALGMQPFDAATENWESVYQGQVFVAGTFDHENQMVLINRSMNNVAGVKVVTPLKVAGSDAYVLVDRGHVPYEVYRGEAEAEYRVQGEVRVEGIVRPPQRRAFFLSPKQSVANADAFKERWHRLEPDIMGAQLSYGVLPVFIEQTNQNGALPVPDPHEVVHSLRHLNYTFQWLGFGFFALGWGLFMQLRPNRKAVKQVEAPA
jgi:surfeit locus 1 family protein